MVIVIVVAIEIDRSRDGSRNRNRNRVQVAMVPRRLSTSLCHIAGQPVGRTGGWTVWLLTLGPLGFELL